MKNTVLTWLLGISFLGASGPAHAQQPSVCNTSPDVVSGQPTWNWEVDLYDHAYSKTWKAYTYSSAVGSNTAVVIGAPWNTNSTEQIKQIGATKDYTKAKGWRLLRVNFGCAAAEEHPWFVLYNQYTGVLRVFVYLNNLNTMVQGAMISLRQGGNRITALGSNASALLDAPDYYLNNIVPAGSDYISVMVTTTGSVKWASADFQTTLDPNTANSVYAESELEFQIHGIQTSTVDLAGKFKFTTEEATPSIAGQPQVSGNQNTFIADSKKVVAKFNSGVKGAQSFLGVINSGAVALANASYKGAYKAPGEHGNFKKDLYDLATGLAEATTAPSATTNGSGIQQILAKVLKIGNGVAGAIPGLSFLGPVLGILFPSDDATAAKSIPFTPTVSTGEISLTGTIVTKVAQNTLRIQTPGTIHNNNSRLTLPYYNCALGIFNISNTPVLERSAPRSVVVETGSTFEPSNNPEPNSDPDNPGGYYEQPYETRLNLFTYKLSNNLNPVFNTSAGLTPVSVQGAIGFRRKNVASNFSDGTNVIVDILADSYQAPPSTCPSCHHLLETFNPTLPQFEAGNLVVNKMDNTSIEFQTPFVDLNCLNSVTAAQIPFDASVFVRVRAIFKRNDAPEQPPIVVVQDYKVNIRPDVAVTHAYPVTGTPDANWTQRQQFPGSGYRTLSITQGNTNPIVFGPTGFAGNNLTIRASESIEVIGNVQMPSGATLALITDFQPVSCTGSGLATPVSASTSCEAYPLTWWRGVTPAGTTEEPATAKVEGSDLAIFPNPTSGAFSVDPQVALGEQFHVIVHNLMGQEIYYKEYIYLGTPILLDIDALQTGIYVVKVTSAKVGVRTVKLQVD